MSSQFTVVVKDARDTATVRSDILPEFSGLTNTAIAVNQGDAWAACDHIGRYFGKAATGAISVNVTVQTGVASSGTATFSTVVATNTVVIGGVTFTGHDSTTTGVQFLTGVTDAVSAASLAAKVNANTTTNKLVVASAAGAVVTFTSIAPGTVGNFVTLTASGVPVAVTGSGYLAGGTVADQVVISEGL